MDEVHPVTGEHYGWVDPDTDEPFVFVRPPRVHESGASKRAKHNAATMAQKRNECQARWHAKMRTMRDQNPDNCNASLCAEGGVCPHAADHGTPQRDARFFMSRALNKLDTELALTLAAAMLHG